VGCLPDGVAIQSSKAKDDFLHTLLTEMILEGDEGDPFGEIHR
jgi:hypothetical protein